MIRPKTIDAVAAAVGQCAAVLPVGARSSLTGGATPSGDVVISTERLTALRIHGDRVTVGAEVALLALQDASPARHVAAAGADVSGRDSWRRVSPTPRVPRRSNRSDAAVGTGAHAGAGEWRGAVVVTRRGDGVVGPLCHRHGRGPRQVEVPALQMPPSQAIRGLPLRRGVDLVDLFIGAEGTLGVVVEASSDCSRVGRRLLADDTTRRRGRRHCARRRSARAARAAQRTTDRQGLDVAAIEHVDRRSLAVVREDGVDRRLGIGWPAETDVVPLAQIELSDRRSAATCGRSRRGAQAHRRHADAALSPARSARRARDVGESCCRRHRACRCSRRAARSVPRGRQSPRGVVDRRPDFQTAAMIVPCDRFAEMMRVPPLCEDARLDLAVGSTSPMATFTPMSFPSRTMS